MQFSRRTFMAGCALAGSAVLTGRAMASEAPPRGRAFHLSVSPDSLEADPGLLDLAHGAGISQIWLSGFLYGYWYYSIDTILRWARAAEAKGMQAHVINVPLGHPGDSLGAKSGAIPLTPPTHWRLATSFRWGHLRRDFVARARDRRERQGVGRLAARRCAARVSGR